MNTIASQITVFPDTTVHLSGVQTSGPDIYDWAHGPAVAFLNDGLNPHEVRTALLNEIAVLAPDDFPTRRLYGAYLRWAFHTICHRLPTQQVRLHQERVQALVTTEHGVLVTDQHATQHHYDAAVLALGNLPNTPTVEQQRLHNFATTHGLFYSEPNFPDADDLHQLTAGSNVILRGLGLSFFDIMARLTIGRGGTFSRNASGKLQYHVSGREPHIIAGSRRGYPYHGKGMNQQPAGTMYQAHFLTATKLDQWAASGGTTAAVIRTAIFNECAYVYYSKAIPPKLVPHFQQMMLRDPDTAIASVPAAIRFDWQRLIDPRHGLATPDDWQVAYKEYLDQDIAAGQRGNCTDPFASMLEMLRDLRVPLREVVARQLLSTDDYLDFFRGELTRTIDFLTVGPPMLRIEQLRALMEAGLVTLLPPSMTVTTSEQAFVAGSKVVPALHVQATSLIEARVPAVNSQTATDKLVQQLISSGTARSYKVARAGGQLVDTGALDVDRSTLHLVDQSGRLQSAMYCWGVPTEGVFWLTTASPHPRTNDINLRYGDQIATEILQQPKA